MKKTLIVLFYALLGGIIGVLVYFILGIFKVLHFLTREVGFTMRGIVVLYYGLPLVGVITGFLIGIKKVKK